MRCLLTSLLILAVAIPTLRAQNEKAAQAKPTRAGAKFEALKQEFEGAQSQVFKERRDLWKKLQETKGEAERKDLQNRLDEWLQRMRTEGPIVKFAPRFLDFAEKNSGDPAGVDALDLVLRNELNVGRWPDARAIAVLRKEYLRAPTLNKHLLRLLAFSEDEASEQFVRDVQERNPDRVVQARAAQALLTVAETSIACAKRLKEDKEGREKLESRHGKEFVDRLIAKGEKAQARQTELRGLIKAKYADIVPDLSAGQRRADVVCHDLGGRTVKLSDYKGKVVVLHIWTTSCEPCLAMIPHEREMVGRLKDKPFALIGISADGDKKTLKEFLAKNEMPWTHWWNGTQGGIIEDWNVSYFPTIYVIDADGVIRHKDLRGEELEKVVNDLLAEKK